MGGLVSAINGLVSLRAGERLSATSERALSLLGRNGFGNVRLNGVDHPSRSSFVFDPTGVRLNPRQFSRGHDRNGSVGHRELRRYGL